MTDKLAKMSGNTGMMVKIGNFQIFIVTFYLKSPEFHTKSDM